MCPDALAVLVILVIVVVAFALHHSFREKFSYAPRGPPQNRYGLWNVPLGSYDPLLYGAEIERRP